MRTVPRLCEFYPGICLTTEEKARKNLSQGKKNLSQSTVYILPKHLQISIESETTTMGDAIIVISYTIPNVFICCLFNP